MPAAMSIRCSRALAAIVSAAPAPAALAQAEMIIEIERPVLRPGDRTIVQVWAAFPTQYYAVAGVRFAFITSVGPDDWSDPRLGPTMRGPGTTPGVLSPTGVDGIIAGQLNWPFPCFPEPCTDTSNPALLWEVTYAAPNSVTTTFTVDAATLTEAFGVYVDRWSTDTVRLTPTEGAAAIEVLAGCYADCDRTGALDLYDFLCFQSQFAAADPYADCDHNDAIDLFDFLCFLNAFEAGCP
ncbi:MAG: GC-type dockerin domain-anchored protein [Phycisphaerales bacterium JB039]